MLARRFGSAQTISIGLYRINNLIVCRYINPGIFRCALLHIRVGRAASNPRWDPVGVVPKRLLNAGAFMITGGGVLPSATPACIPGHEPDIDRAAEGLSRAASAAVAGTADAGVRARHRGWRGYLRRHLRARAIAQGRARIRRGDAAAHRRSGPALVPPARTVPGRRQFGAARPGAPRLAVAGLAMAAP